MNVVARASLSVGPHTKANCRSRKSTFENWVRREGTHFEDLSTDRQTNRQTDRRSWILHYLHCSQIVRRTFSLNWSNNNAWKHPRPTENDESMGVYAGTSCPLKLANSSKPHKKELELSWAVLLINKKNRIIQNTNPAKVFLSVFHPRMEERYGLGSDMFWVVAITEPVSYTHRTLPTTPYV